MFQYCLKFLAVVNTSWSYEYAKLIRREAAILKILKHPLVSQLHGEISERPDHNSLRTAQYCWDRSCDAICLFPGCYSSRSKTWQYFGRFGLDCTDRRFRTESLSEHGRHYGRGQRFQLWPNKLIVSDFIVDVSLRKCLTAFFIGLLPIQTRASVCLQGSSNWHCGMPQIRIH
jgi:hypothetical protein